MTGQVALTFVLLTGSGLLIRSLLRLQSVDTGFQPSSTVTMNIQLDGRYDKPESRRAFFRTALDRVSALPGVTAAAGVSRLPLGGGQSLSLIEVEGFGFDDKTLFEDRATTPGYFAAMGIPLLEGRTFTDEDIAGHEPVIIVSRSFARKYFAGQSALGKRVHTSGHRTIVGVVGDVRQWSLESKPPMQFYTPLWESDTGALNLIARTKLPPAGIAASVRRAVRELDPAIAVADIRTGNELVAAATAERRFETFLLSGFGAVALFLSLVGVYGMLTYAVEQRTSEIGIRLALGAQRGSVLRLVLGQGSRWALSGIGLGFAGAWLASRAMASLLFEVTPTDPVTFLTVAALFCAVALAACYLPARRATAVDPLISLRAE